MIYLYLFITFFEIGLFGFGGGYGMLSLIQNEVVRTHGWMTMSEFTDIVAISQMTPGPIGINHSRETRRIRRSDGNTRQRNRNIRIGIAIADIDDTHQQDVP